MPEEKNDGFDQVDGTPRGVMLLLKRPQTVVFSIITAMVLAGWVILIQMSALAARTSLGESIGPGAWLLRMLPDIQFPSLFASFFALCFGVVDYQAGSLSVFLALWIMWFLMALAMMVPSALPLVQTYCDIADAARKKAIRAVHPLVLMAGYLAVWAIIAALFSGLVLLLNNYGATTAYAYPVRGVLAPAALAVAGVYQFSGLKQACLIKCRNPFATLFAKWSDRPGSIFILGAKEGLYCAGCCWALMLIMFAVGIMNVFWMALLTMLVVVEKSTQARWVTAMSGAILLVWAAALMFIRF